MICYVGEIKACVETRPEVSTEQVSKGAHLSFSSCKDQTPVTGKMKGHFEKNAFSDRVGKRLRVIMGMW